MGKVLITGGAGFIGSHLCDQFVDRGDEVICVDNFVSGRRENIAHLESHPNFELLEHDVSTPLPQSHSGSVANLSAIFHFASPASPNPSSPVSYMAHPVETLMVNSMGTKHMLELATDNDCQIVLASTSEVYGDPEVHPQSEDYVGHVSPNGPRSCYDEGKRFLEAISFAYHRTQQTKIKVVRIFNTYGPRMDLEEGRFIPTIVNCHLTDSLFLRHGDGSATRSFCYVDDLVGGILAVEASDSAIGQVINLGNPDEYSVNQAITVLEELTGNQLQIKESPALPDDPQRRKPDIQKATTLLAWEPKVSLKEGLSRMIESYEKKA
jgi:nucleoside-diphosphate-sugar epimerase